ncbi:MAG: BatA domain-containing protein, partial [Planctomycetota bacterium]
MDPAWWKVAAVSLEWLRPWVLLLVPAVLLFAWLLKNRSSVRQVSSTFLWRRLGRGGSRPWVTLVRLLFLVLVSAAAARPFLSSVRDLSGFPVFRVLAPQQPGDSLIAEVILAPGQGERSVQLSVDDEPLPARKLRLKPGTPVGDRVELPASATRGRLRLRVDG